MKCLRTLKKNNIPMRLMNRPIQRNTRVLPMKLLRKSGKHILERIGFQIRLHHREIPGPVITDRDFKIQIGIVLNKPIQGIEQELHSIEEGHTYGNH
jgi:hypothetical protein